VAERDGPSPALALLDRLAADLDGYHLFHAARADLLHRLGRDGDAAAAYDEALARTTNGAERDLLQRQLVALRPPE
jgi:RNA polymerase sigma-70 factor (ECF subfamily)